MTYSWLKEFATYRKPTMKHAHRSVFVAPNPPRREHEALTTDCYFVGRSCRVTSKWGAYLVDGATKTVGARVALRSDESLVSMKWRV
jgi:hypothetical protein